MIPLPPGWRIEALGEVAETALGKMLDRGRPQGHAHVPYLRNVNVQWGRIDTDDLLTMELSADQRQRFGVQSGDLLVCEGGDIGRAAIWRGDSGIVAYQKALHRVRSRGEIDLNYLRYLLELYSRNGTLARYSTGSTIAHLPQQQLRRLPVPIPDLDEQRRIVEVIEDHFSRLDAGLLYLKEADQRTNTLTKALLFSLIPEATDYPRHWRSATVAEAGSVELGRQRHPDWHTGPNMKPYLRVANVFEDRICDADLKWMHWPDGTFERFRLHPGDILLNEGQSPDLLGRPAIYRGVPSEVAFTNSLLRFRAGAEVLPEFALLVFRRHMHAGRFTREARITTNIAHLSASRLKPIEFPIPPRHEQRQLVGEAERRLSSVQSVRRGLRVARGRSQSLRQALLDAAFRGRLTGHTSDDAHPAVLVGA